MLVILIYRLSLIVVRRETRNLLFPYLACRKKAEEARAFPGFLRIDIWSLITVYRNLPIGKRASTHIVNTTRNSAFPLSILSYASFTFSSGYFSTIAFTPVNSANRSVSSESIAVPEGQP